MIHIIAGMVSYCWSMMRTYSTKFRTVHPSSHAWLHVKAVGLLHAARLVTLHPTHLQSNQDSASDFISTSPVDGRLKFATDGSESSNEMFHY